VCCGAARRGLRGLRPARARARDGLDVTAADIRGTRGESTALNLFVRGAIEDAGRIVASIDEALDLLRAWRSTTPRI
jgi:hypothetical protein